MERSIALSDEIRSLRARTLAELTAAYDYFADTKTAWRLVRRVVKSGHKLKVRNKATSTITTQAELVARAPHYIAGPLAEATFQQFIALFEGFYFDLLQLWLTAHPQSLGRKTIELRSILDLPDKDAVVQAIVLNELHEVVYKRPADWFAYLEERAKLGCPSSDEIARITEAKATRDVLVHNRGVANATYLRKAGALARVAEGEYLDVPAEYHRAVWNLLRKVVADLSDAALAKAV
ncbi:MAG TPA: hypothetical protein VGE52_16940 [Pirellulales bacterium]